MKNYARKLRILIIDQRQFGYRNTTYYISKYLANKCDISYYGWHTDLPEVTAPKIELLPVRKKGNLIRKYLSFITGAARIARSRPYDLIHITYFPFAFMLSLLLLSHKKLLDIRTGGVKSMLIKRIFFNITLRFDTLFYRHISIISHALARKIWLPKRRYHLLPLGAEIVVSPKAMNSPLNLIYIGTLNNRNLETTIEGFKIFIQESGNQKSGMRYTLIGPGKAAYQEKLKQAIAHHKLSESVKYLGMVPHDRLVQYMNQQAIGISYIPLTSYFDCQPPTKTIEYLLCGLPVLATNTSENRLLVSKENGILIDDSAVAFADGLKEMVNRYNTFNPDVIRESAKAYQWEYVILDNYYKYIISL